MNDALIGLGSNIRPRKNIFLALCKLDRYFTIHKRSKFIRTKPIGYLQQPDFVNGVIEIRTRIRKNELIRILKSIEKEMGRVRTSNKNGPRVIDLDLLIWNDQIVDTDVIHRHYLKKLIHEIKPAFQMKQS